MSSRTMTLSSPAAERGMAQRLNRALGHAMTQPGGATIVLPGEEEQLALTPAMLEVLSRATREFALGNALEITPVQTDLTSQQAANMLGISRPYLVTLLDRGDIPSYKVGNRRRVSRADVEAYRESRDAERRKALRDMSDEASEAGYY